MRILPPAVDACQGFWFSVYCVLFFVKVVKFIYCATLVVILIADTHVSLPRSTRVYTPSCLALSVFVFLLSACQKALSWHRSSELLMLLFRLSCLIACICRMFALCCFFHVKATSACSCSLFSSHCISHFDCTKRKTKFSIYFSHKTQRLFMHTVAGRLSMQQFVVKLHCYSKNTNMNII